MAGTGRPQCNVYRCPRHQDTVIVNQGDAYGIAAVYLGLQIRQQERFRLFSLWVGE
jgi:hypothetical protein